MENQHTPIDNRLSPMWMPQVSAPLNYVKGHLDKMKISHKLMEIDPNQLVALQDKVDKTKVEGILREIDNNAPLGPIFVSGDNEILDGHHRAYAFKQHPDNISAMCIKLYMDYRDAARVLNQIQDRFNFETEMGVNNDSGNLVSFNEPFNPMANPAEQPAQVATQEPTTQVPPVSAANAQPVDAMQATSSAQPILEPQVVEQAPAEPENPNVIDCTGMHPDFLALIKQIKQNQTAHKVGGEPEVGAKPEEMPVESGELSPEDSEGVNSTEQEVPTNTKSMRLYKTKATVNQTSKTGDFLLVNQMQDGTVYEFEVDFDNLLEISKDEFDSLEFPTMAALSKLGYTGDTKMESNKLGLTREVFISRKVNELAFNRGYDGIQYGEEFVQVINKPY